MIVPIFVIATCAGVMTVHYKQGSAAEGFNATVTVLGCPDKCPRHRVCRHGACVCPDGSTGPECNDLLCPNNCTADLKQGVCDKVYHYIPTFILFINYYKLSSYLIYLIW